MTALTALPKPVVGRSYSGGDSGRIVPVKVSVSMKDEDVAFLDRYAADHGVETRSGAVQRAVALLRAVELGDDYEAAWREWDEAGGELWEAVLGDGLGQTGDPG